MNPACKNFRNQVMNQKNKLTAILMLIIGLAGASFSPLYGQSPAREDGSGQAYRLVFYNLENFYDTLDAPFKGDDAFLPAGPRRWNAYKYRRKLNGLFKILIGTGHWRPPAIIGVCEVENRRVLDELTGKTPLAKYPYRVIHKNSPDPRGIDVAAIYHERQFKVISSRYIKTKWNDQALATREILYIKGHLAGKAPLHLFFNHWPSKWQGAAKTQPKRKLAARVVSHHVDSIFQQQSGANIIVAGDFNDPPQAACLTDVLGADQPAPPHSENALYNLCHHWKNEPGGTQKYRSHWQILDQFIVSGAMLNKSRGLYTCPDKARPFAPSYLLEKDTRYTGMKPFRTYTGYRYTGGFSDHLPVILEVDYIR